MTVTELRKRLEELEATDGGYGSWELLLVPDDNDDQILDDVDYRVCGVNDPPPIDPSSGFIALRVEWLHGGINGRSPRGVCTSV
jgi:hypothetical protein